MALLHELLDSYKLLLASASPRRQGLLFGMDLRFEVVKNEVDETYPADLMEDQIPIYLAEKKSLGFNKPLQDKEILITSDTIVWMGNAPLEKAESKEHAAAMLKKLSGNTHRVYTGVCLRNTHKIQCFSEATHVTFESLTDAEIEYYLEKYQPYDKAGAYGMQEWIGINKVSKLEGSYTNVVGLPTARLYAELLKFIS